ncbi:MAG: TolC family protein [Muribaculaceae bacterium]|nr:TolC family protein [Muribaculaceae bacterium]
MNRYIAAVLSLCFSGAMVSAQPLELSLAECREMAIAGSEQLRQAENSMQQATIDTQIATTAYLPKFEGSATGVYMLPDMDMAGAQMRMRGTYMAGIQLMQPIYTGGKITAGRKLARIGREASAEQLRMTRMDVIAEADNAYWSFIAVSDKVRLMQQFRQMIDTLYEQTAVAVEAGMATENDLLRINAKRSEIIYQQQKVANGADLCRMALCNAIGVSSDTEIIPADTIISPVAPGILVTDISDRPELHLLEKQIEANRQQVNMARADFLPSVGLMIGYTYYGNIKLNSMVDVGGGMLMPYSQEFRDGIAMGMLSVKIPIFHWGEGLKKVRKAKLAVENAGLDLQRTSRLLDLEARQAASNLTDGWAMISSASIALDQATENLRVMQARYDEAMAPLTDLLDAQNQWHQARSNHIEALTQYQIYQTAWLRATGRL